MESFAQGGRTCITSRVYPTKAIREKAKLYLFNNATESKISASVETYQMTMTTNAAHTYTRTTYIMMYINSYSLLQITCILFIISCLSLFDYILVLKSVVIVMQLLLTSTGLLSSPCSFTGILHDSLRYQISCDF